MKDEMAVCQSGLHLPVSRALVQILKAYLPEPPFIPSAVTLNFRDPQYSEETGGFHPVEIRLTHQTGGWYFDYITDFSYSGHPWPELEKEIDFCWSQGYVWYAIGGDLDEEEGEALFEIWQRNFIQYCRMKIYTVTLHTGN